MRLGDRDLCDRCFDRRIAALTGHAELPEPPSPDVFIGPDGRAHRFLYRLWRAPTGVAAEAEEEGSPGNGYRGKVLGAPDANVGRLLERLRERLARQVGQLHLEPHPDQGGWIAGGMELRGRLEWAGEPSGPYDVVVDGRRFTWEEFGRVLEPFEGWDFRLSFEDEGDEEVDDA